MSMSSSVNSSLRQSRDTICRACQVRLSRQTRNYAATATATTPAPSSQEASNVNSSASLSQAVRKAYRISIAPVVSRPPLLTRELSSFEKAFYLYQKRLNERLARPPTRYFYYPKGTPADSEWKRKIRARQTAARDIGVYNAYGKEGWQDEVLLGDKTAERESVVEALVRDAEGRTIVDAEPVDDKDADGAVIAGNASVGEGTQKKLDMHIERPLSRVTEADEKDDRKSLNRKLDRVLYLLVKNVNGKWKFPEDRIVGKETLHQATERILVQAAGINMNTWVVGNHPVGHYRYNYGEPKTEMVPQYRQEDVEPREYQQQEYGGKTFFMKTRIMAGQANLEKNIYGDSDFQWLAKEEIQQHVSPSYWAYISNMLTER